MVACGAGAIDVGLRIGMSCRKASFKDALGGRRTADISQAYETDSNHDLLPVELPTLSASGVRILAN